jgi:SAM-dependent methyltransferase
VHWKLKALIQFAFAHLPGGERLNHAAQLARGTFGDDFMRSELEVHARYLRALDGRFPLAGRTVVEIGPGWAGLGTLLLATFGVERIYAIDHRPHLRLPLMQRAAAAARSIGLAVPRFTALEDLGITYLAPGDAAATGLSAHSVDLVYSHGVLEHIPREALSAIASETRRILKPGGRACHTIGLHDHFHSAGLGNGVNFLRYSRRRWNFMCGNAINYHNRLRLPEYIELFADAGLTPAWMDRELLDLNLAALRQLKVHRDFERFSEEELAASHLFVDLTAVSAASSGHRPAFPQATEHALLST